MKITILCEQYALLEIFYNELDEDEESFLGNGSIKLLLEDWQFACMRELFQDINERNARMRHPSPMLVIDETLYPYCGHIGFKHYISNKPAKYSLLY